MTIATTAAVLPVVDYEPCPMPTRPRTPESVHPPRVRSIRTPHRRPEPPVRRDTPSARFVDAAKFTDAAVRSVLEVIDRRRPLVQLRPMLTTGLIDSVAAVSAAAPARDGTAVLRRVRLQAVDPGENIFEVAAAYTRGRRRHALACRVQQVSTAQETTWRVVALHIG